jgi:hypothetical protein
MLVSLDISEVPLAGETFDVDNWSSETFTNNGYTTTEVTNIYARRVTGTMVKINNEWFTDNHNILVEKDGVYSFTQSVFLDTTYKIFDYNLMGWRQIDSVEIATDIEEIVYVVDCEPYDIFFTQNALVYNRKEWLSQ